MAFAGRRIGDLTIARALEIITPFDRSMFFPETTPADWAPYESWLKPKAMDPAAARCCSRSRAIWSAPRTTRS